MNETADSATRALIARYYGSFNRADWTGMVDLLSDEVVHDLDQGVREVGREHFLAFLQRMARCYLEVLTDIRILASADGRHAAAEYVVSGQYMSSDSGLPIARGQRYRLPGGALFEVLDGRITRFSNHYNLSDWLAQINRED